MKMADRPLHCTIKNTVTLTVEDQKNVFHSGCKVIDVTFPNVSVPEKQKAPISFCERVGEIRFKNYYTAYISIRVKFKSPPDNGDTGEVKWKTCLRKMKLMPNPHKETGSQDYFSISKKQFAFDLVNLSALRIIIQQPSPVWKEFKIEDLRLYRSSEMISKAPPLPAWLTEETANSTKHKLEDCVMDEKYIQKHAPQRPENDGIGSGKKGEDPRFQTGLLLCQRIYFDDPYGDHNDEDQVVGIPNLESISSNLQQLWALSEEMATSQTQTEIGRYEVDGCYEINLLSYT